MAEQIKSLKTGIKYKDTPIGKIPVDWEVIQLKNIVKHFFNGGTPDTKNKSYWAGNIPWITGADFEDQKIRKIRRHITGIGLGNSSSSLIPKGNLLVVTRTGVGKVALAPFDVAISQDITGIILASKQALPEYIYWYLDYNKARLAKIIQGTSINGLLREDLGSFHLTLPTLAEQHKIAKILSTVDEAIEKTDQIIEKTAVAKKGLMQRLLTSGIGHENFKKTILGKIPIEWNIGKLGDMCIGQPEYGANVSAIDKDASLPRYVRITDITEDGELLNDTWQSIQDEHARPYMLTAGDVLFARSGATVGKTYLYHLEDGRCAFAGYLIRFKPNPKLLLPEYLFHYIHSDLYYNWVKGMFRAGAQPNINAVEYSGMLIPTPPISEQKMIVRILDNFNKNIDRELYSREHLNSLKNGLMQVLLTGRIRVKA